MKKLCGFSFLLLLLHLPSARAEEPIYLQCNIHGVWTGFFDHSSSGGNFSEVASISVHDGFLDMHSTNFMFYNRVQVQNNSFTVNESFSIPQGVGGGQVFIEVNRVTGQFNGSYNVVFSNGYAEIKSAEGNCTKYSGRKF